MKFQLKYISRSCSHIYVASTAGDKRQYRLVVERCFSGPEKPKELFSDFCGFFLRFADRAS
jgi:hypothetical protein